MVRRCIREGGRYNMSWKKLERGARLGEYVDYDIVLKKYYLKAIIILILIFNLVVKYQIIQK